MSRSSRKLGSCRGWANRSTRPLGGWSPSWTGRGCGECHRGLAGLGRSGKLVCPTTRAVHHTRDSPGRCLHARRRGATRCLTSCDWCHVIECSLRSLHSWSRPPELNVHPMEMLDRIGSIFWFASPVLGFAVTGACLYRFRRVQLERRFAVAFLLGLGAWWLPFFASLQVLLRDGMGPGMISSHGAIALERVFEGLWAGLAFALVPFGLGVVLLRWSSTPTEETPR